MGGSRSKTNGVSIKKRRTSLGACSAGTLVLMTLTWPWYDGLGEGEMGGERGKALRER